MTAPAAGTALARLRPDRATLVDAAFVLGTCALALWALHGTFGGTQYLVVGGIGAVVGLVVAHLAGVTRVPWPGAVLLLAVAYLLLGGAVALRADPRASAVPSPGTVRELYRAVTGGWAQLLTTLPPVDGSGPLLALPFVLGVVGAGVGLIVATRTRASGSVLVPAIATVGAGVLLGVADPADLRWNGLVLGLGALAWISLRSRRRVVSTTTGATTRAVTAAVVLALACAATALAAPALPGTGTAHRTVLRAHLTPPLDLSAFPSPLVGYRKYRPSADQLADVALLTVSGLPSGVPIRIATLDNYDGVVWGVRNDPAAPAVGTALDTFQRTGARIAPVTSGRVVRARVTVGSAYAAAPDTSGWLPATGSVTSVRFGGADADAHATSLRYNLATGTAVVPDRLRAGDSYTFSAVVPRSTLPRSAEPGGPVSLDPGAYNFVQPSVTRWVAHVNSGRWRQLLAIAEIMRTQGAFSDGGTGEGQYLPGHGIGRLTSFLKGTQLVGDDEQYAATFALVANDLGLPARVVVGAEPESGVVYGRDIHAWVEVRLRGHGWVTIPSTAFVPPTSHKPKPQRIEVQQNSNASVVPPPNAVRPPSSLDQLTQAGSNSARRAQKSSDNGSGFHLPGFVVAIARWGGPPVLAVVLVALIIVLAKAVRRRRRSRSGTAGLQVAAGWREILDQARDLGRGVTTDMTRGEQARAVAALGHDEATTLAQRADRMLFAPRDAEAGDAADFWFDVRRVRRDMLLGVKRWPRLRARLSLRSFRGIPGPGV